MANLVKPCFSYISSPSGTAPNCTCATGTVQKFITVTASYSYVPIFAKFQSSYALSETVTVRED